jgi:hypothetical protein
MHFNKQTRSICTVKFVKIIKKLSIEKEKYVYSGQAAKFVTF